MAAKDKTCKANVGTRKDPRECGQPVAKGMLQCCQRHSKALVATATKGVYARGARYVFIYRDADGAQRWEAAGGYKDACDRKAARKTDVNRDEAEPRSNVTLHEYAHQWIDGNRSIREQTRGEYRRMLERYALRYFPADLKLTSLRAGGDPKMRNHVAGFVAWLGDPDEQAGARLSDKTIRNIMGPLRACLATAVQHGLIRSNPARDVRLPRRPRVVSEDDHEEEVRALDEEQLATLLGIVPPRWRTFFELLAATGLRVSEAIALQWRHISLDGENPHVKVRRAIVRGQLGPPKSDYSRRDVPISHALVIRLRQHRKQSEWPRDDDLVFTATGGQVIHVSNLRRRVLKPAAEEAGVPWASGFHVLRHTAASMLFAGGRNAVQVQRFLGHHDAAFTLRTYIHLLKDDDLGGPLELPSGASNVQAGARVAESIGNPANSEEMRC